ncbi:MAG: DUF1826 domain-containing protein [Acetobacter sp.]
MRQACPTRQLFAAPPPFHTIRNPACSMVQEPRQLSEDLRKAAALWTAQGPRLFLKRGSTEILETELIALMPAGAQALIHDMLALAHRYQALSDTREIRFRLEKIDHDSCCRFHVDTVPLRLLCTYTGPGVQWKHNDSETVHETPEGWLTLLKGRLYPGWSADTSVLHRSPPLSGHAKPLTRLLLTLDHPDACGMNRRAPMMDT